MCVCVCVFSGKQVIHPGQIQAVQEEFSPSQERVQWATELIAAFEQHQKEGKVTSTLSAKRNRIFLTVNNDNETNISLVFRKKKPAVLFSKKKNRLHVNVCKLAGELQLIYIFCLKCHFVFTCRVHIAPNS